MDFTQYTKTCQRCSKSWWESDRTAGEKLVKLVCPHSQECMQVCENYREHEITHEYFFGHLKPELKKVLTGIYHERVKRGEF